MMMMMIAQQVLACSTVVWNPCLSVQVVQIHVNASSQQKYMDPHHAVSFWASCLCIFFVSHPNSTIALRVEILQKNLQKKEEFSCLF